MTSRDKATPPYPQVHVFGATGASKTETKKMGGDGLEVLIFKDSFHACHVLDTLRSLYKERKLCDVTLVIENQKISAHRLILAANSSYFFSMFTSGLCESNQETVALKEVDFEAVDGLVEYCYTSTIEITEKNVQNILSVANLFQFTTIVETCCGFLKNQLHPSNCLGIGDFADHLGCSNLREAAHNYAEKNFLEVSKTDEFLLATLHQVQTMLNSDFLNVITEKEVFDACIQWIRHDLEHRKDHLADLMRHIRLPLLPPKILGMVYVQYFYKYFWRTNLPSLPPTPPPFTQSHTLKNVEASNPPPYPSSLSQCVYSKQLL